MMGWGNGHRFEAPQVRTYAQALAHYESVKPVRGSGRNGGKRPIGKRNGLTTMNKNGNGSIEFVLYRTPVLTFNTDDTIDVFLDGWISSSTGNFISEILNTSVYLRNRELHLVHFHGAMRDVRTHVLQDGTTLKYNTDQHGQVDIDVEMSKPVFVHRLNRQRWKEIRGKFSQFREYVTLMSAMNPEVSMEYTSGVRSRCVDIGAGHMSWSSDNQDCVSFLLDLVEAQRNQDLGPMLNLFKELVINNCPVMWRRTGADTDVMVATATKESVLKALDEILKHVFSRDLFEPEQLPDGKYTKDSNKRYVKYTPREVEYNKLKAVI